MKKKYTLLDCTLRDGGYYNNWDFSVDLINQYLWVMKNIGIDIVELGLRSLNNKGFKGPCAFTTDEFIRSLKIPSDLSLGVMINGAEIIGSTPQLEALERLFPVPAAESPISIVRIACHLHEFKFALPATVWLKGNGYKVGFNLMQVASKSEQEIEELAFEAAKYPIDVLYFADSLGGMSQAQVAKVVQIFQKAWRGPVGIHTHDNLGLALSNSLCALDEGATWVDSTVSGMGRGPGNTRTEELVIEVAKRRGERLNLAPLMSLLRKYFMPMKAQHGWGTNPYYYLAGIHGIHPTFIQEMLDDARFQEEDILAVIEHLRTGDNKNFGSQLLESARQFYRDEPKGTWSPSELFSNREILLLGAGPSLLRHRNAIESYISKRKPVVIALNIKSGIEEDLIDFHMACHPVRLLADCRDYAHLQQPLITPYSVLPKDVQAGLKGKKVLDFGLSIQPNTFKFFKNGCIAPNSLVVAYALAVLTSGDAKRVLLAGFDGYGPDDQRTAEMRDLLECYQEAEGALPLAVITPSHYGIHAESVYAL